MYQVRAGHLISGTEVLGPAITVTVDATAPAAPTFLGTMPASPANNNLPLVRGTAEPGSTVRPFGGAACTGPALVTGQSETFASTGLSVVAADNSTSTFRATAQDLAGNVSECSAGPLTYEEGDALPAGGDDNFPDHDDISGRGDDNGAAWARNAQERPRQGVAPLARSAHHRVHRAERNDVLRQVWLQPPKTFGPA